METWRAGDLGKADGDAQLSQAMRWKRVVLDGHGRKSQILGVTPSTPAAGLQGTTQGTGGPQPHISTRRLQFLGYGEALGAKDLGETRPERHLRGVLTTGSLENLENLRDRAARRGRCRGSGSPGQAISNRRVRRLPRLGDAPPTIASPQLDCDSTPP
ncbi:hypothetical protein G7Z17_g5553 [Cylindrodendrum hubeiense]|uniref:Uncharacterized protein n=1 Tax=Cylindrodendrum hubeiense TaxID=595255 RepID=A0A9P5HBM2_9HYPO|nr:hypothetical protein G7Z17_g5553 [Cylindrodendrum hubeiense]